MTDWISCSSKLPSAGSWVYLKFRDVHSPSGYGCGVGSIVFGISEHTRDLMKRGLIPDPYVPGWTAADGYVFSKRSSIYFFGDVYGNNTVPYEWKLQNSPRTLFGQQVLAWRPLEVTDNV